MAKRLIKHVDYPDIAVIDEAIKFIKRGDTSHCCLALADADPCGDYWSYEDSDKEV